jgi:hypothetical protein
VPQGELAALTLQLSSKPTQSGGSDSPPTNVIVAALVGDTNAGLVPAQVQSIQGQNASQTAGLTQVQPGQSQTLAQTSQQSAQRASQQNAVPQVPLPALYARSVARHDFDPESRWAGLFGQRHTHAGTEQADRYRRRQHGNQWRLFPRRGGPDKRRCRAVFSDGNPVGGAGIFAGSR